MYIMLFNVLFAMSIVIILSNSKKLITQMMQVTQMTQLTQMTQMTQMKQVNKLINNNVNKINDCDVNKDVKIQITNKIHIYKDEPAIDEPVIEETGIEDKEQMENLLYKVLFSDF